MSDFQLAYDEQSLAADLQVGADDLLLDDGLRSAIVLSLFTHRRAEDGDVLPDGQIFRRGWWADEFNETLGDKFGSRLWLLDRSKRVQSVLDRAEVYAREALAWLVEDRVALAVNVSAEFLPNPNAFGLVVTVVRPNQDLVSYRFGQAWAAEESRV